MWLLRPQAVAPQKPLRSRNFGVCAPLDITFSSLGHFGVELRLTQLIHRFGPHLYCVPVPLLAARQSLSTKQVDYVHHAQNMDTKALFYMARYEAISTSLCPVLELNS